MLCVTLLFVSEKINSDILMKIIAPKMNLKKIKFRLFFAGIVLLVFFLSLVAHASKPKVTIRAEMDYTQGEILTVYASLTNKTGEFINASTYCNITITHWNGTEMKTDLDNVAMNFTGRTGWYFYSWQIPEDAAPGSYGVLVRADPNGIETQATSGFHVAPWTKEIQYIWQKYQRVNTSVIHNETITSATLSSELNITIFYNITIPLKEGFTTSDYLPMRWKFWFVDLETYRCMDQSREQRFIEPYCNPLVAQVINLGNATFTVNITMRPSLKRGNYTMIRELEVDPEQVWVSYGHGSIANITVLEDNFVPVINVSTPAAEEYKTTEAESYVTTTTTIFTSEQQGQCIQILIPVQTTTTTEKKTKIISFATKEQVETTINWNIFYIILFTIISILAIAALLYYKKQKKTNLEGKTTN